MILGFVDNLHSDVMQHHPRIQLDLSVSNKALYYKRSLDHAVKRRNVEKERKVIVNKP